MRTLRWLMALALVVAAARGARAQDRVPDRRPAAGATGAAERQTRGETAAKLFVQGRYDEALAIYLDLYVQSGGRPEYLRNIGRCQQKLKQYDRAIDSLKDYLRRARSIAAAERTEVQGFISEMEAAKAAEGSAPAPSSGAAPMSTPASTTTSASTSTTTPAPVPTPALARPLAATSATPPGPPASQHVTAAPAAPTSSAAGTSSAQPAVAPTAAVVPDPSAASPPPVPGAVDPASPAGIPPVLITRTPGPASATESSSWSGLKIGGVVALIGAGLLAAGGTAMLLAAQSTYDEAKKAGCPTPGSVMCDQKANSVTTSNQISQVLYIGAGVAGAAGVTLLILAPGPGTTETRVSLGARFKF